MDIHYSADYYWADSTGKKLAFDELQYPDFASAIRAFEQLKHNHPTIHPQPLQYRDLDSIRASWLIENVELAFKAWRGSGQKHIPFHDFCEYILPYRVSVEPVQPWRERYMRQFAWLSDSSMGQPDFKTLSYLGNDIGKWFVNIYGIEERREPLPRLSPLQLLGRKKGACEDIADLAVFILRSQGIAAAVDEVPYWATSSGSHFVNNIFDAHMRSIPFDASTGNIRMNYKFVREPAKVIRCTYAKQPNALAALQPAENIPPGFMRRQDYIDVTEEYWPTRDVQFRLHPGMHPAPQIVYACVWNNLEWKPVWWGKVKDGSALVSNLCKGAAFLPAYYTGGRMIPAGNIVLSGYNNELRLAPDTIHTRTVTLQEEAGYLKFQPGKSYKLYYWNNKWQLAGQQKAGAMAKTLVFTKVPSNALLLLVPEYSQRKERPFVIMEDGKRWWW